ncbi:hypothetical protein [Pseudonocardia sp. KRD291]|uniref:hypothetical protein n=1 Tax=Pseudonocardia sp. KRD291 TaxID=2792007 RepID=UPI001C4A5875|nr:hypothetical protein [Pseudonocardia sp. KRD291]MBW0105369.1 hypothetical protein [Pseudonocardia sp. KRD291]
MTRSAGSSAESNDRCSTPQSAFARVLRLDELSDATELTAHLGVAVAGVLD